MVCFDEVFWKGKWYNMRPSMRQENTRESINVGYSAACPTGAARSVSRSIEYGCQWVIRC